MKAWQRVSAGGVICGGCGSVIETGGAVLVLIIAGVSKLKRRSYIAARSIAAEVVA